MEVSRMTKYFRNIDPNKDGDDIKENDDNKEILVNMSIKLLVSV